MFRRLSQQSAERGSAVMAVIGVMAVVLVITLTVTSSSLQALSITTSTRAGVQAQAAAEAGFAFAMTHLGTPETCPQAPLKSSIAPIFTATVLYLSADNSAVNCADAVRLIIVSTGTAANPGEEATSTAETRTVEAVFEFAAAGTSAPKTVAAIYSDAGGSFAHSSKLSAADGSVPVIQVRTGDPSCADSGNPSKVYSPTFNLVIADGGMSLNGSCEVSANVWASGAVELNSSVHISGNLISKTLLADSSVKIHGSVWTTGSLRLKSSVEIHGTTVAGSLLLESSSEIQGDAWSSGITTLKGGSSRIGGDLSTKTFEGNYHDVKGQITYDGSLAAPIAPAAPVVSDWVSVSKSFSEWSAVKKVSTIEDKNGDCVLADVQGAIKDINVPMIIDALECKKGLTLDGSLSLSSDLVILARDFVLIGSIGATSPDTNLWLITPDDLDKTNCKNGANGGGFPGDSSIGKLNLSDDVAAMLYTPCEITLGEGASWRGQLYGNSVQTQKGSALEYVYVGLPDDSNFASAGTGTGLGKQLSVRDRNDLG